MRYANAKAKCCSPIEERMLDALLMIKPVCADYYAHGSLLEDHPYVRLYPQYQRANAAPFVLDFALIVKIPFIPAIMIDVECDGHDFHEREPEQVERDNRRSLLLVNRGWRVIRFSGREINAGPAACAKRVEDAVDEMFANWIEDLIAAEREAA